jgi:hypothetical protein
MKLSILAGALALACAGAAHADECGGAPGQWSFGGVPFATDAGELARSGRDCNSGLCSVKGADGLTYVLKGQPLRIVMKARLIANDERLPFGVTVQDNPQQAMARVLATGARAGYGRTADPKPVSVVVGCREDAANPYLLQYRFDQGGRMTGLTATWLGGQYIYVDDPTFHMAPEKPTTKPN